MESIHESKRERKTFFFFVRQYDHKHLNVCVCECGFIWVASFLILSSFLSFFSIENSCCLDRTMHHHHHHHSMVRRWWLGYGLLAMNYQLLCTNKTFITAFSLSSSFPILFEKMTLPLYHQIPLFIFFTLLFPTDWLIRIRCICV